MNLDQKVKCPECYFIFKNDSSRKYINCPECKAELNQKDLTVITDDTTQMTPKSIFTKALENIDKNLNKNNTPKAFLFLCVGLLFLTTGCGQKIINKSIEKIPGDSELIQITRDLYAVMDGSNFANSGFYINPKENLLFTAALLKSKSIKILAWLKNIKKTLISIFYLLP